jgi:hypothetical protein
MEREKTLKVSSHKDKENGNVPREVVRPAREAIPSPGLCWPPITLSKAETLCSSLSFPFVCSNSALHFLLFSLTLYNSVLGFLCPSWHVLVLGLSGLRPYSALLIWSHFSSLASFLHLKNLFGPFFVSISTLFPTSCQLTLCLECWMFFEIC